MSVANKTCKYILENPQSKLCNIREMEINNNGNNGKCAVNDDTTSDNSTIPIILLTSPKEGRKIVFINEMKDLITNIEKNGNRKKSLKRKMKIFIN